MAVRAKFKCHSKALYEGDTGEVVLNPVYGNSGENSSWSRWTPAGEMKMTITNPEALEYFKPGVEYNLLIERAEDQDKPDAPISSKLAR